MPATPEESPLRTCPICGQAQGQWCFRWRPPYQVYRCLGCRTVFTDPLPTSSDLDAYYQGFLYRKPAVDKLGGWIKERQQEISELFEFGRAGSSQGRFLDHGGGTGVAFKAAAELGLESYFSDLDRQAQAFVREQFGLDDSHMIDDVTLAQGRFDYILSDNVIEHVPDPAALLRQLVGALAPGGTLVVKTPHAGAREHFFYPFTLKRYLSTTLKHNSWPAVVRLLTTNSTWYCDPPRHLYSFSMQGLDALCRGVGLHRDTWQVGYYGTPLFRNTLTEKVLNRPKRGRRLILRGLLLPAVAAEVVAKGAQAVSVRLNQANSGGLYLRVRLPR